MPRCRSHNLAIWLRSKSMPPVLLSNRIKSFPAPFILVKRNIIVIVAAATPLVMSSGYPHPIIVAVILSEAGAVEGSLGMIMGSATGWKAWPRPESVRSCVAASTSLGMTGGIARWYFSVYLSAVQKLSALIVISILWLAPQLSFAGDCNDLVLEQVRQMPEGGRYSVSHFAKIRLESSAHFESGKFFIIP